MNSTETPLNARQWLAEIIEESGQRIENVEELLELWRRAVLAEAERAHRWSDQNLYDAYLCGCEDDCLPEPMSKTMFLAQFTGGK